MMYVKDVGRFAQLEVAVTVVTLLQHHRLRLEPGAARVRPRHGFVTKPDREILVQTTRL
jgi:hypothetical protein